MGSLFSTVYILAHLPITNQNFASLPNAKMDFLKKGADMLNKNKEGGSAQQQKQARLAVLLLRRRDRLVDRLLVDRIMVIRHSVSSPRRQDIMSTPAPAKRSPMVRVACTRSRLGRRLILSGRTRC